METTGTDYRVKKSRPGMGRGLFTTKAIKKGDFVIEYTGERIPAKVADTLGTRYLFEIDDDWTIDGSSKDNLARYVNHSCDPNCEAEERDGRIYYYAIRNIAAGEELTIDYGQEYFDEFIKPAGCKCGAAAHRR